MHIKVPLLGSSPSPTRCVPYSFFQFYLSQPQNKVISDPIVFEAIHFITIQ
uniref:Uncharacterized protein n=1 Tax=Arundo donax TaxID=35708 RepID=A0A0A8ZT75_ARUDO